MYGTKVSINVLTVYRAVDSVLFCTDSKSAFDDKLGMLPKYNTETPNILLPV